MSRFRSTFAAGLIALVVIEATILPVFAQTSAGSINSGTTNALTGQSTVNTTQPFSDGASTAGQPNSSSFFGSTSQPGNVGVTPDQCPSSGTVSAIITSFLAAAAIAATPFFATTETADALDTQVLGNGEEQNAAEQGLSYISDKFYLAITIGLVATLGVVIGSGLIDVADKLNNTLFSSAGSAGNPLAGIVYAIAISLMNLAIVLGFIVVAYGTIFRIEAWGSKNLPRLIITALLINFSWLVATWIASIGTSMTTSMAGSICSGWFAQEFNTLTIWQQLTGAFVAQGPVVLIIAAAANLILASVITLIAATVLFATACFLFARFVILILLIGLAPVAWLSFMLPELKIPEFSGNTWNGWWSRFLKWVFFAPIMLFFIWLTEQLLLWFSTSNPINSSGLMSAAVGIGEIIAIIVMLSLSLYIAYKTGGAITTIFTGAANLGMGGMLKGSNYIQLGAASLANNLSGGQEKGDLPVVKRVAVAGLRGIGRSGKSSQESLGHIFSHVGVTVPQPKYADLPGLREPEGGKLEEDKIIQGKTSDAIGDSFWSYNKEQQINAFKELKKRGDIDKIPDKHRLLTQEFKDAYDENSEDFGGVEASLGRNLAMQQAFDAGDHQKAAQEAEKWLSTMSDSKKADLSKSLNGIVGEGKNFLGEDPAKNQLGVRTIMQAIATAPGKDLNRALSGLNSANFKRGRYIVADAGLKNFGNGLGLLNPDNSLNTQAVDVERTAMVAEKQKEHQGAYQAKVSEYNDLISKQQRILKEEQTKAQGATTGIALANERVKNLEADQKIEASKKQQEMAKLQQEQQAELQKNQNSSADDVISWKLDKDNPELNKVLSRTLAQQQGLVPPSGGGTTTP